MVLLFMRDFKCLSPSDFAACDSWLESIQVCAWGQKRGAGSSSGCVTCLGMFVRVLCPCVPFSCGAAGRRLPEKNAANLFPLPCSLNSIRKEVASSEAALAHSAVGSRLLVFGLVAPGSCVSMQELHISLCQLKSS